MKIYPCVEACDSVLLYNVCMSCIVLNRTVADIYMMYHNEDRVYRYVQLWYEWVRITLNVCAGVIVLLRVDNLHTWRGTLV